MLITKDLYETISPGEIFKVIETRFQAMHKPGQVILKFVCVKGVGPDGSWALYCGQTHVDHNDVAAFGDKVTREKDIQALAGVDDEVMKLYRQ